MTRMPCWLLQAWRGLAALLVAVLLVLAAPRLAQAQTVSTCGAATTAGTAPADFRDYCWLNFAGYSDSAARGSNGQGFRFDLPDGTRIALTLRVDSVSGVGSGQAALSSVAVPSWSGSAFGNQAFLGIPGRPVLYNGVNASSSRVTLSNIVVTPPSGGTASYSMIVADGESSNAGETLVFNTDGAAWTRVAAIRNGGSTTFPGENNAGQTVTLSGVNGTVGSYVYRSDNSPRQIRATITGGGLQGAIIGVRYASISVVSQFTGARYYPADQVNYLLRTTSGSTLVTAATSGAALNNFPAAIMPTVAASYPFQVVQTMAAGSPGTLANYATSLTCVNNATSSSPTPMPVNQAVTSYTFDNLRYGDSVVCTFTNTPIFSSVAGTVYSDANRNGAQDGSEAGTGLASLYVKLVPSSGTTCTGPAHQAVPVAPASGAYAVPNVPAGDYCLVLDNNNTLSDITPTLPAGWLGLQNASGSVQVGIAAGSNPEPPQHFGLFNGSRLTGSLFVDSGTGGAVANDGVRQAAEAGLGGLTVNATAGAATVATAVTAGDGSFTLWLPASAAGPLIVGPAQGPTGFLASGGSTGNAGGAITRPNLVFTPVAGQVYSGVAMGFVQSPRMMPNGMQAGTPGGAVFYAHTFEAGSGGQVSFSLAASASPALSGWTAVLYRDGNCNGTLDAGEPVLSAALTVTAGEEVCLVVKQFVPAGASSGAQNKLTVSAQFTFSNAVPALAASAAVEDVTSVGEPAALVLQKRVSNVTRGGGMATSVNAAPGEVLQYTLIAQNQGSAALTELAINDTTAAFTTFVAASCPAPLPAGITACTLGSLPAVGAAGPVQWTFTGTLAPGAQLTVTYQVRLDQ